MKILLLAGEESGLLYAHGIAAAVRTKCPDAEIKGYEDYGFETHDMAVMGILPVLLKIGYFLRLKWKMQRVIAKWHPDAVITVDYPGMNLKLAAYAHSLGIRAVHVVCPQVWAWKKGRIPRIEASLDKLCCFLPFEPRLFKPGFATFVGHPLVNEIFESTNNRIIGNAKEVKTVALLPGSRKGEIEKILPILLEAAVKLNIEFGDKVRFVIPAATPRAEKQIYAILHSSAVGLHSSYIKIQLGGARELLKSADCAAVASGTATLEAALARCPTILVYRMTATFAWIVRHFVRGTRFAGLANIIWDRCRPDAATGDDVLRENKEMRDPEQPMPELIQENLTPEAVQRWIKGFLEGGEVRKSAIARLDAAMAYLRADGNPFENIVSDLF